MYSNEESLKDTYSDAEVSAACTDAPGAESGTKLAKAAAVAAAEIDVYLLSGGYALPLLFTPYGEEIPTDGPPYLNAKVLQISDAFTMFHLTAGSDVSKTRYDADRAAGIKWFEDINDNGIRISLTQTDCPTGSGQATTIARCPTFTRNHGIWPTLNGLLRRYRG